MYILSNKICECQEFNISKRRILSESIFQQESTVFSFTMSLLPSGLKLARRVDSDGLERFKRTNF